MINERLVTKKNEIQLLIAESKIEEAIKLCLDIAKDYSFGDTDFQSIAIGISSRFYRTKRSELKGTESFDNLNLSYNRNAEDLLALIKMIETTNLSNTENANEDYIDAKNKFIEAFETREKNKDFNIICQSVNLSKSYSNNRNFKLSNVQLSLKTGEITGVVGENAAGKTTLLELLAGVISPSSGSIDFPFFKAKKITHWWDLKKFISYIPQQLDSWSGTVLNNLTFTAAINGMKGEVNKKEVAWMLYRLELDQFKHLKYKELSGGYKMRFHLANALLENPAFLLLDEPLANLDVKAQMVFLNDLRSIASSFKHPLSVLITSQNIYELEEVCDRIIFIREGTSVFYGRTEDLNIEAQKRTYEVIFRNPNDVVLPVLQTLPIKIANKTSSLMNITTSMDFNPNRFLKMLNEHSELEIQYFRDISNSSKKLFS